ncbi:MAG: hypothetical protein H7A23_25220 [Leptospiraceae bacterium]|nr:hypothetical protein [Leptospiraceae bacterium]MCP5497869.1 hypothetical protein [Leptospiraceae bacterium]
MKKKYFLSFILYFLLIFTHYAESKNKPLVTQDEVTFWGFIFFALSMGSLLLIVFLLSNLLSLGAKKEENIVENEGEQQSNENWKEILQEKKSSIKQNALKTVIEKKKEEKIRDEESFKKFVTAGNLSSSPEKINGHPQDEQSLKRKNCEIYSSIKMFELHSYELDGICKDFLLKMSGYVTCKSLNIYFCDNEQFYCYMEKSGTLFIKHENFEKSDITEEIIKYLKNKLGAFSSDHKDAFLPLIKDYKLFGALKIQFSSPPSNFDITPLWSEVKEFSQYFFQSMTYQFSIHDEETPFYNIQHFHGILNYRTTLNIPQNLTLIRVLKSKDNIKTFEILAECIREILAKKPEIYRISDNVLGLFLTIEDRDKIVKSINGIISKFKKFSYDVEICLGSADYHSSMRFPHKWLERANQSLSEAIDFGPNNYKLFVEK